MYVCVYVGLYLALYFQLSFFNAFLTEHKLMLMLLLKEHFHFSCCQFVISFTDKVNRFQHLTVKET